MRHFIEVQQNYLGCVDSPLMDRQGITQPRAQIFGHPRTSLKIIVTRASGPVLVGLLIERAAAVSAEIVERRFRQELFGVQVHEEFGVAGRDGDEGFQHGIDDV